MFACGARFFLFLFFGGELLISPFIPSQFERGFIRAETLSYDELVAAGSEKAAKEKGQMRSEGKDYVVQEADVMLFRFNV